MGICVQCWYSHANGERALTRSERYRDEDLTFVWPIVDSPADGSGKRRYHEVMMQGVPSLDLLDWTSARSFRPVHLRLSFFPLSLLRLHSTVLRHRLWLVSKCHSCTIEIQI